MSWRIEYKDTTWKDLPGEVDVIIQELSDHEEATFFIPNTPENREIVKSDKRVRIWFAEIKVFDGIMTGATYEKNRLKCIVYDECRKKLAEKDVTGTYNNVAANTILSDIATAAGVVAGACPTTAVSVRFRRAICLDAAQFLADCLNKDIYFDRKPDTDEPRVNISDKGSAKGSVKVLAYPERGIDRSKIRDKVIIRGFDEEGNEIEGVAGTGDRVAVFTEKKASDVATLNRLAEKKLAELNKASSGVKLPVDFIEGLSLTTGDIVTLENEDLELVGNFRIFKITKKLLSVEIEVDKPQAVLEKQLIDFKRYEDYGIYYAPPNLDNPPGPPASPTGLTAKAKAGAIELSWNANTEADLDRYIIFKGTADNPTDEYKRVDENYFIDENVFYGTTYYYRLKAVDRVGNQSDYSASVSTSPLKGIDDPVGPPAAPTGLVATGKACAIELKWNPNTEADLAGYIIYRGTAANPTIEYARTFSNYFVDRGVTVGTTYYYRVRAVDKAGNLSDYSENVSAKAEYITSENLAIETRPWTADFKMWEDGATYGKFYWSAKDGISDATVKFSDGSTRTIVKNTAGYIPPDTKIWYCYWQTADNDLHWTQDYAAAVGAGKGLICVIDRRTDRRSTILHFNSYTPTIGAGAIAAKTIISDHLVTDQAVIKHSAQIEQAIIKDAHIDNVNAEKIKAGTLAVERLATNVAYIRDKLMIGNSVVTNDHILNLNAGKLDSGYLPPQRLDPTKTYITDKAMIGQAVIVDAHIDNLDAGKIKTGYLSADRLSTNVAYIRDTLMLKNFVVTTAKCAENFGIKSAELPVVDPDEYTKTCTAPAGSSRTCPYSVLGTIFKFNAYPYIKHELKKVVVDVKIWADMPPASFTAKLKCEYSIDNGTTWSLFGIEKSWTNYIDWTLVEFIDNVLTDLNKPFWVRLQAYLSLTAPGASEADINISIKNFELRERAFRGRREDI